MNTRFLQVVVVDDYHDLQLITNAFLGLDLSYRELGTTYTGTNYLRYVGVIFDGYSPGDGELCDAIVACNIELEKD